MRRLWLALLLLWMHTGDLLTAWLYQGGAQPAAAHLRSLRDLLIVALAGACLLTLRLPRRIFLPLLGYAALCLLYLAAGWAQGNVERGILVGSAGTLLIPLLLCLAGYFAIRGTAELRRAVLLVVGLGVASACFGAWDRLHSEFWIDTLQFPAYIREVKGVLLGANPMTGLPWNFYGGVELQRRAAGLLAAPLAQGMFLAIAGVLALALVRQWRLPGFVACVLCFVGIWQSATRGAMLAGGLALLGYLYSARGLLPGALLRVAAFAGVAVALGVASYGIVLISVGLLDGSTIGHLTALQRNLGDIHQVLLLGAGIGRQGAQAAQAGLSLVGGGEGAIFTIAYQLGVPAALCFLAFFGACLGQLRSDYRHSGDPFAGALFWIGLGVATTLVSSDHVLTVSGSGAFWLLCGGALRVGAVARQARAPSVHSSAEPLHG